MLIDISEDEPLNADESEETEALILTAIEERVRVRNERNSALMRVGNPVLPTDVFDRGSIVSLFIPKPMRLTGEVKRVFCRVVQHTRAGYQLNTRWGLLHGRFEQSQLNGIVDDRGEIPALSPAEASKVPKVTLNKVASLMNDRASITVSQRAGRKRRQGKRGNQMIIGSPSTEAEDIIEVDARGGSPRRHRTASPDRTVVASSPSLIANTGRCMRRRREEGIEEP